MKIEVREHPTPDTHRVICTCGWVSKFHHPNYLEEITERHIASARHN